MVPAARVTLIVVAALLPTACTTAVRPLADDAAPTLDAVPVVWGWGGRHRDTIVIGDDDWAGIVATFEPPSETAAEERSRIALAVSRFESIAAGQTPIGNDAPGNRMPEQGFGQCDCLDESANTTTWLALLRDADLLRRHDVLRPICRSALHWSAAIRDRSTGQVWMIDTWEGANGEPPLVMKLEPWSRRRGLP